MTRFIVAGIGVGLLACACRGGPAPVRRARTVEAYNPRELLDAALREWVGEHGGLPACRTRAIEVQMATVRST
jgi:hypothetical protein